jgi:hypothetical protein
MCLIEHLNDEGACRSLTIEETHSHYFSAQTPRLLKLGCYIAATAR